MAAVLTHPARLCKTCRQTKPASEFYFKRNGKLSSTECRACVRARSSSHGLASRAAARAGREAEAARLRALSHKVCTRCKVEKSHGEFYVEPHRRDGFSCWCKNCQQTATRSAAHKRRAVEGPRKPSPERVAERQALYDLAYEVKAGPCVDCGQAYPPQIMHFHHLDQAQKTDGVARLIRRFVSPDVLRAEIAKCVVLCPNCHALRHHREARPEEVAA